MTPFPLNRINLDTRSNEELISLGETAPVIYSFGSTKVVRLSVGLVLKFGDAIQTQEVEAMKCVLSRTNVPTPKLRRYFFFTESQSGFPDECGFIVMDYLEGDVLFDIWNHLDDEKRKDIIQQVADHVSQLQAVHFEKPGPLGGGRCRGFWFTDYDAGPFENKNEINAWFTHKLEISKAVSQANKQLPPFDVNSFVLVHHDLNPVNLMLDSSGKVWIIDWGAAGAYPILEAGTMTARSRFKDFSNQLLPHIYNNQDEIQHLMGVLWGITIAACA
jgi:aminoglycoside phosphotransferase (APT) family kinase protein